MILYHGTNLIVEKPHSVSQNRFLDFGFGFYTTTNLEQAKNFAKKVVRREGKGKAIVNVYNLDLTNVDKTFIKKFGSPNEEWLDFVAENRNGIYEGKNYGIVIGPVANDDVYRTLQLYLSGVLTKEQTLETLKIKELYDQYVFTNEKTMSLLKFDCALEVE